MTTEQKQPTERQRRIAAFLAANTDKTRAEQAAALGCTLNALNQAITACKSRGLEIAPSRGKVAFDVPEVK